MSTVYHHHPQKFYNDSVSRSFYCPALSLCSNQFVWCNSSKFSEVNLVNTYDITRLSLKVEQLVQPAPGSPRNWVVFFHHDTLHGIKRAATATTAHSCQAGPMSGLYHETYSGICQDKLIRELCFVYIDMKQIIIFCLWVMISKAAKTFYKKILSFSFWFHAQHAADASITLINSTVYYLSCT